MLNRSRFFLLSSFPPSLSLSFVLIYLPIMSATQATATTLPRLDLSKSEYDLSTYWGRAKHFFNVTDPRTILASEKELYAAKALLEQYRSVHSLSLSISPSPSPSLPLSFSLSFTQSDGLEERQKQAVGQWV